LATSLLYKSSTLLFLLIAFGLQLASAQIAQRPETYDWITFESAIDVENNLGKKKVLVDVFSPNCSWCARMYREVYSDSLIHEYLSTHFRLTQLDLGDFETPVSYKEHDLSIAELAYGLGASGTPTTVFLDHTGDYITRLEGFHASADFLSVLKFISTEAYLSQSFSEFIGED
jgi:thioredoxin-related protein